MLQRIRIFSNYLWDSLLSEISWSKTLDLQMTRLKYSPKDLLNIAQQSSMKDSIRLVFKPLCWIGSQYICFNFPSVQSHYSKICHIWQLNYIIETSFPCCESRMAWAQICPMSPTHISHGNFITFKNYKKILNVLSTSMWQISQQEALEG